MLFLTALLLVQGPAVDSLTLDQALARARTGRGQLAGASARLGAARAAYRVAGAVPNPTLTYSHSESFPQQHFLFDQPLDWLLRRRHDRKAARFGISSAEADSTQAAAGLDNEVRVTFYAARAAIVAESLTSEQAALADSLATIGAVRLRAGDISLLEAEQGRAEAARAHRGLSESREAARVAGTDLARVVGADPNAPPRPLGALDADLDRPFPPSLSVESVPAVRSAVADSAAAAASVQSANLARLPLPTLQTGAEWEDPTEPNTGSLAVIGVALPIPLWQHGSGVLAEARARAQLAAAQLREARLDAAKRVADARIHLEESGVRARFARDTLLPAARALRARAVRAYQAGETGILPVLEALRSEREAAIVGVQDLLAYQTALADWIALLGYSR
jgi:cobalt-zinc-cadmium efflux system outer membrane protein